MLSNKIIQKLIQDLKKNSKTEIAVLNSDINLCATTFDIKNISIKCIKNFLDSMAQMQTIEEYNFFKVIDERECKYIVITKDSGQDSYMIGKICVSQMLLMMNTLKEKIDESSFIKNLLLDNISIVDLYNKAKKIGIENDITRVVMIVETFEKKDNESLELIRNIFYEHEKNYITSLDERNIIIIKSLEEGATYDNIEKIANILLDMFNTELMINVKISYGTIFEDIKDLSKSYREAKMSMDIGDLFYTEKSIIGYNTLGIGRLIYHLPENLCRMFIDEVFKDTVPSDFDDEVITIIHKFFENNLNISETARKLYLHRNTLVYRLEKIQKITGLDIKTFDDALTFKLGLMIVNYMKHLKNKR